MTEETPLKSEIDPIELFGEDVLSGDKSSLKEQKPSTVKKNKSKSPTIKKTKTKKSENKTKKTKSAKSRKNSNLEEQIEEQKIIPEKEKQELKEEEKEEKEEKNIETTTDETNKENVEVKKKKKKKKQETETETESKNNDNSTISDVQKKNEKVGKKKGKKKKAADNDEQTNEEQTANKSKIKEKSKDKTKGKKKEKENAKIEDPKQCVYDYMKSQNRPYSLINIFDNLHGAVKKSQLQKILDELVSEGSLIVKEYNTKIYLFNQEKLDIKVSQADLDQLEKEISEQREKNKELREILNAKNNELRILTSTLTDEELELKIIDMQKEINNMKNKVEDIKNNKIEPVPPEKMNEVKTNYEEKIKNYKKTKKICEEIIGELSEGLEMSVKELYRKIGIENDDALLKELGIDPKMLK